MRRLACSLLLLSMLIVLLAIDRAAVAQVSDDARKIIVVYVAARDCPYCRAWESSTLWRFERSAERKQVDFRIVQANRFNSVDHDMYWPKDIRWIRDRLSITRGTPRFIIATRDDFIVMHRFGSDSWQRDVFPLIQQLVGRK